MRTSRHCACRRPPVGRAMFARDVSPWNAAHSMIYRPEGGRIFRSSVTHPNSAELPALTRTPLLVVVLIFASQACAATIPQDKQIKANITATFTLSPDDPLHLPTDVAVDNTGRIYVADGVNDRIVIFNADGSFQKHLTHVGEQALNNPISITFDDKGNLWITDNGNHQIVVVNSDAKLVERIALPTSGEGHPADPTDVVLSAGGAKLLVVDNDGHRVLIREGDGPFRALGSPGRGPGRMEWPFMAAAGTDGTIYIIEAIGGHVQRLDKDGQWLRPISSWGVELSQLYRPKGIAIDKAGDIFVSDSTTGTIQAFGPQGAILGVLCDSSGEILRLQHPMGISFDAGGRLYVVESAAARVTAIELPDRSAKRDPKNDEAAP